MGHGKEAMKWWLPTPCNTDVIMGASLPSIEISSDQIIRAFRLASSLVICICTLLFNVKGLLAHGLANHLRYNADDWQALLIACEYARARARSGTSTMVLGMYVPYIFY